MSKRRKGARPAFGLLDEAAKHLPLPPTHPDGHRRQVALCHTCSHPTSGHIGPGTEQLQCDCCSWRKGEVPTPPDGPRSGRPEPITPDWVQDKEKWRTLPRATRRALMRHHERETRGK